MSALYTINAKTIAGYNFDQEATRVAAFRDKYPLIYSWAILVNDPDGDPDDAAHLPIQKAATVNVYLPVRGSRVYAALWLRSCCGSDLPDVGSGWAGGGGYDKVGAAIHSALGSIGIDVAGCCASGRNAVIAALESFVRDRCGAIYTIQTCN